MLERFIDKKFSSSSLAIIQQARGIIDEYQGQGFKLTLRQLYYQFVARDLMPNTVQSYKRLGSIISDARLAGYIDWESIEDRTRNLKRPSYWSSPESLIDICAEMYDIDKWADQKNRVEVWIEKEALVGVIAEVCDSNQVPYFACRGYVSQSEQYEAAKRHRKYLTEGQGQDVTVLHLGDHDPSGLDMTRDNSDRLDLFESATYVKRIALNMDQIVTYNPPPNPAKVTDSRFDKYLAKFGTESWELDALEPRVIADLIETEIDKLRDHRKWESAVNRQREQRRELELISSNYIDVVQWLTVDQGEDGQ